MRVKDCYNLQKIITELEAVLQVDGIDYDEININKLVKAVKQRLERQYHVSFAGEDINETPINGEAYQGSLVVFIDNVARIHSVICGYAQICRYTMEIPISLSSINYMGFTRETFKEVLVAAQTERRMVAVERAIDAIGDKLCTVSLCNEKRILMGLYLTYKLGLYELTASIAELLYLSMID